MGKGNIMGLITALVGTIFEMLWSTAIMAALTVSSILYQRMRQKQLASKAAAEADRQKGFRIVTEGESTSLPVAYGRNKVGGNRVYHRVASDYTYANADSSMLALNKAFVFTSVGDGRTVFNSKSAATILEIRATVPEVLNTDGTVSVARINYINTWSSSWPSASFTSTQITFTGEPGYSNVFGVGSAKAGFLFTVTENDIFSGGYDPNTDTAIVTVTYSLVSYNNSTGQIIANIPTENASIAIGTGALTDNVTGTKHEFLFVQQAICRAGISKVWFVDVNDRSYNDAAYRENNRVTGHRIHVYTDSVVDPLVSGNDSARNYAAFNGCTHASMVFRLDRDNPAYTGVPSVTFYVEGQKVKRLTGPDVSLWGATTTYTNNPAEVLLDYLTNADYGRGLASSQIDWLSFYRAKQFCDYRVISSAPVNGKLWTEISKVNNRNISRFECNLMIDTSRPIRDNIELILGTMEGAELIWSDGKYKLSLVYPTEYISHGPGSVYQIGDVVQYPAGYTTDVSLYRAAASTTGSLPAPGNANWTDDVVVAYLTDNDIVRDEAVGTIWPSSQERLNYCTVKFSDESEDFAENSVSWPSKNDPKIYNSTGGIGSTHNLYELYRFQDNDLPLESEITQVGCSDSFHAEAVAEERVRSSRAQVIYKFALRTKYAGLEPGDIIKITSIVLGIDPGELLQIEEVKVSDAGNAIVQAIKYDCRNLAWNAADTEYVQARNIYLMEVAQASNLFFSDTSQLQDFTSGVLTWAKSPDPRVVNYIIKFTSTAATEVKRGTAWIEVGQTSDLRFELPSIDRGNYTFTVVAQTAAGKTAPELSEATGSRWPLLDITLVGNNGQIVAAISKNTFIVSQNPTTNVPVLLDGGGVPLFFGDFTILDSGIDKSHTDQVTFSFNSAINCTVTMDNALPPTNRGRYVLTALTAASGSVVLRAVYKGNTYNRSLTVLTQDNRVVNSGGANTPTPGSFAVNAAITHVFVTGIPVGNYTEHGGYHHTEVFAWSQPLGYSGAAPTTATGGWIDMGSTTNSVFTFPTDPARIWWVYVKWVSRDQDVGANSTICGGNSAATSGVDVSTLLTSLTSQITESQFYTALGTRVGTGVGSLVETTNNLKNQWSVKIDNYGYVSGFGLSSVAPVIGAGDHAGLSFPFVPYSTFAIRADEFYIASPAGPGVPPALPFVVRTTPGTDVDGVYYPVGVYMKAAFIAEATITTAKIADAAIDSAKIADASIGTLKVAGNAITGVNANTGSGGSLTTSWLPVVSTSFNFGSSVTDLPDRAYVSGMCQVAPLGSDGPYQIDCYISSSDGATSEFGYSFSSGFGGTVAVQGTIIPTTGSKTYTLYLRRNPGSSGGANNAGSSSIFLTGAKR
jgi:hypothetical protein